MSLADQAAQHRTPFVVMDEASGRVTVLNNTSSLGHSIERCAVRYVLRDEVVRLCAELAYSRAARTIQCADLLHAPAEVFWIEWSNAPWRFALEQHGFPLASGDCRWVGRRGALVQASSDGRRGLIRTFWSAAGTSEVLASSVEAYFDFDTVEGEEPRPPDNRAGEVRRVGDDEARQDDVLGRCFRFRYEKSWADYYERAALPPEGKEALWRHNLGTIAMDVPTLLTFFLLLASRSGLPQRLQTQERLNRARRRAGKPPLLDHIEVHAPLLPEYRNTCSGEPGAGPQRTRRGPRLHHVRGHLVRRGNQLFWRVPHLRGSARWGMVRSHTVVWTFDETPAARDAAHRAAEQTAIAAERAAPYAARQSRS